MILIGKLKGLWDDTEGETGKLYSGKTWSSAALTTLNPTLNGESPTINLLRHDSYFSHIKNDFMET
jgi:hypothetical protein